MSFKQYLKEEVKLPDGVIRQLESFMTEWFNDTIEVISIRHKDDEWIAQIGYDGNNNKDNRGTVTFKCSVVGHTDHPSDGDEVEDFEITNVTGMHYKPFSDRLERALGR